MPNQQFRLTAMELKMWLYFTEGKNAMTLIQSKEIKTRLIPTSVTFSHSVGVQIKDKPVLLEIYYHQYV